MYLSNLGITILLRLVQRLLNTYILQHYYATFIKGEALLLALGLSFDINKYKDFVSGINRDQLVMMDFEANVSEDY